jgi:hypothetical protein
MIIPEIKLVRKVRSVKPIPNQIPHINMPRSTQSIPRVTEKPVISTMMFTVLEITPITSSLLASSHILAASRYPNSRDWTNLEVMMVRISTSTAKTILNNTSVEKNHSRVSTIPLVCTISSSPAAQSGREIKRVVKNRILRVIDGLIRIYRKIILYFSLLGNTLT